MKKRKIMGLILLIGFIVLTILLLTNNISSFDDFIYKYFFQMRNKFFDIFFIFFTRLGDIIPVTIITICLLMIFNKEDRYILGSSMIITLLINQGLKYIIQRPRPPLEERLISQIDRNATILKSQLQRENKSKENDNQIFGNFLENEMPKIIKEMKIEAEQRQKDDIDLSKLIDDGFTKLYSIINEEKLNRENTENSLVEMIKGIMTRMNVEIENEKSIRDANEKNLINILEQTIQKLNFPA